MYKILIVEDDNTIAERLASHLKKWNYKTVCVREEHMHFRERQISLSMEKCC